MFFESITINGKSYTKDEYEELVKNISNTEKFTKNRLKNGFVLFSVGAYAAAFIIKPVPVLIGSCIVLVITNYDQIPNYRRGKNE